MEYLKDGSVLVGFISACSLILALVNWGEDTTPDSLLLVGLFIDACEVFFLFFLTNISKLWWWTNEWREYEKYCPQLFFSTMIYHSCMEVSHVTSFPRHRICFLRFWFACPWMERYLFSTLHLILICMFLDGEVWASKEWERKGYDI